LSRYVRSVFWAGKNLPCLSHTPHLCKNISVRQKNNCYCMPTELSSQGHFLVR
jgi:hypothetical protein